MKFSWEYILLIFFLCGVDVEAKSCNDSKPNIIILLMDDMGWGDLGINGNPSGETPNLDQMAKEGMRFMDLYTANAICSPSRAALLTGRLPIRNGFYTTNIKARDSYSENDIVGGIPRSEILISEVLADIGYRNKIIGKWHLGHSKSDYYPWNRGFHEFFGSFGVHFGPWDDHTTPNVPVFRNDKMIGRFYENIEIVNHVSTFQKNLTKEAIDFIQKESTNGNPFFLYWAPDTLHAPNFRSSEFVGRSIKSSSYGDALIEMDQSIGQILDTIRNDECLAKNTFVFFTSDNGAPLAFSQNAGHNGPFLCGKQTTFEGGFREPGIAWWPGRIEPQTITRQPSTLMDLFKTIVNLTGAKIPDDRIYDSQDLSDLLFNGKENLYPIFYYRGDTLMAIRYGPHKAHYWTFATPEKELEQGIDHCLGQRVENLTTTDLVDHRSNPLLFHLYRDPSERRPINNNKEYHDTMEIIQNIYEKHLKELKPGEPQLNYCDPAAMQWNPPGCEEIHMCLPVPKSNPHRCHWPH